ncbi:MAG: thymidine kinase [Bacilli bacterium]|jgi:thymidine kinase|nr:thymidine kinase [Bacilli bacterium]MCH4210697.1 thymidine kinase [Bacilli bacterium]MCH4229050.1 thymidine kinase [Bacilli bacterium]MCH4278132.1 thymidine kinase [Bacilli bacterium]
MENYKEPGWIEVITGPMFAGKSEELIRRLRRLDYAHKKYLVFKPDIDNRYSEGNVESHLHNKAKCIPIKNAREVLSYVDDKTEVIAIDEVQFLDEEIVPILDTLADKGIRVIVAGLDTDFKGEPFPIMASLLCKAEFVSKLTAVCVKCGAPATMTQRIVNGVPASKNDPVVLVGASEAYEPRCRHCHELRDK